MSRYYVLCAIIIAHHKLDDQIGAVERVDIYRQSLSILGNFGIYASQTRPHQILYGIPKV